MVASTWNYKLNQKQALKISRSRLQLFLDCPRCFWLLMRQNIKKPSMPDFLLNIAVDKLFKKEFDVYREKAQPHPLMRKNKIKAIPFKHQDLAKWLNPFEGVQYLNKEHNFLIFGGLDDVWVNEEEELIVVDYKATAKDKPVEQLYGEGTYHDAYRRQMEVYQWLLKSNGFKVSPTAYFVYATALNDGPKFGDKLNFVTNVIAHEGKIDWIEGVLKDVKVCLDGEIPQYRSEPRCGHCYYVWQRLSLASKLKQKS